MPFSWEESWTPKLHIPKFNCSEQDTQSSGETFAEDEAAYLQTQSSVSNA
jgi:hypothetical protein